MLTDEKLLNTVKLIALKNAIDFNNNINFKVVISKTFSYLKHTEHKDIKELIPDIKKIISELSLLSIDDKKIFYERLVNSHDHYLSDIVLQNSSKFHSGIKENNTNSILKKDLLIFYPLDFLLWWKLSMGML